MTAAAAGTEAAPRRTVGRTTATVAGAGVVGPPVAAIVVHLAPSWAPVEWALAAIIGWAVAMVSGYLLPPQRPAVVSPSPDAVEPEGGVALEAALPGAGEPVAVEAEAAEGYRWRPRWSRRGA